MRLKLRLIFDIEYAPHGVSEHRLRYLLEEEVAGRALNEGLLTGDTEAEVEAWQYRVVRLKAGADEGDRP
jgi:hypothetical protein